MPTLYFQLERSKTLKDKYHPIYLVLKLREGGRERRFRHYTGRSALKNHWIGKGENKRVSSKAPGAGVTNDRLQTLRLGADAIISNAKNVKADLTLDYFRERFNNEVIGKRIENKPHAAQPSFFEYLEGFIDAKRNIIQPTTIKSYVTLKRSLEDFEKVSGYKLQFESINHTFITLYTKYLIEEKHVINSTLAKRISILKTFLTEMKKQKIQAFTDYEDFEASRNYETTIMYLTQPELMRLYNLETDANSTEQHVRDAFCFACFTGLRFSDWKDLTAANIVQMIHEGETLAVLKCTMFKVHKEVIVPLTKNALSIIDKYRDYSVKTGRLFPVYTNQETNRTLKDLAKRAKINDTITDIKKSGAKRITYSNAKHEILTCHDATDCVKKVWMTS